MLVDNLTLLTTPNLCPIVIGNTLYHFKSSLAVTIFTVGESVVDGLTPPLHHNQHFGFAATRVLCSANNPGRGSLALLWDFP